MQKLLIITDSEYFINKDGSVYLFNSVCNEMISLTEVFDDQILIGNEVLMNKGEFQRAYSIKKVVRLNKLLKRNLKINLIFIGVIGIFKILRLNSTKYIHVRGPSIVMLIILLISPAFRKRRFWFKYANVWNEQGRSIFWDVQKYLLKSNKKIKVTINGNWPNLPKHIIPFENPCFYKEDIFRRHEITKNWDVLKQIIFVGRMTKEKGIFRILECLGKLKENEFESMLFIGTGKDEKQFEDTLFNHPYKHKIIWKGGISKDEVMLHLRRSHILFLPTSEPEGFPKVVSEAWLNKCIPIVSDISCIPQYVINGKTGFIQSYKIDNWIKPLRSALAITNYEYGLMDEEILPMLDNFTYEYFGTRILNEVFEVEK